MANGASTTQIGDNAAQGDVAAERALALPVLSTHANFFNYCHQKNSYQSKIINDRRTVSSPS
jgi:hypothetical protein